MSTPIDLYRLVMGGTVWTLTSSDADQIYSITGDSDDEERYISTAMSRGEINQKNEMAKAHLEVNIPLTHALAISLLAAHTDQLMIVTVFEKIDSDVNTIWKGRLASIRPGDTDLTLIVESIFTSMRRMGLRAKMQRSCRHALYSRGCFLDMEDFVTAGTLNAIAGDVLTIPEAAGQADGYFLGGILKDSAGLLAYIIGHTGSAITVQRIQYSLATEFAADGPGVVVSLYPGCDHTRATCNTKFSNGLNYGGFDYIPLKNPQGGVSVL